MMFHQNLTILFILSIAIVHVTAEDECTDVAGWVDSYDDGCDWYEDPSDDDGDETRCEAYGNSFANDGHTANTACCVCGGGEGFLDTCENVSGWVDCGNDACSFYEDNDLGDDDYYTFDDGDTACSYWGDGCPGPSGLTPNEACCVCGGGNPRNVDVTAAPVTPGVPTKSPTKSPTKAPVTKAPTKTPTPPVPEPTRAPVIPVPQPTKAPVTGKPTRAPVTKSPSVSNKGKKSKSGSKSSKDHSHHTYKSNKSKSAGGKGSGKSSGKSKTSSGKGKGGGSKKTLL